MLRYNDIHLWYMKSAAMYCFLNERLAVTATWRNVASQDTFTTGIIYLSSVDVLHSFRYSMCHIHDKWLQQNKHSAT